MKEWEEEAGATGKAAQSLWKVSRHTSPPARAQASIVACQEQQGAHARDETSLKGRDQYHQVGGQLKAITSCLPPRLIEGKAVIKCKPYSQIIFLFSHQLHKYSSTER